ncbi:MAG: glycosyltransferase [Gammaproteobacteria bacterium]|nr:glycosyltransferase [Gammaproteobacteria bacterium]
MVIAAAVAALLWFAVLIVPWQPWRMSERLPQGAATVPDGAVTVLIPARNEAGVIGRSLAALKHQGGALRVILVDDASTDGTAAAAQAAGLAGLVVIASAPLPAGWTGKLWALEQGRAQIQTPYTLLLDADIELKAGLVGALLAWARAEDLTLVSLMAAPAMRGFWDRWFMPAFVYFFKLLYPFRLANRRSSRVAAAAGGCVLVKTQALADLGGFGVLRGAVIDDCTLARHIKRAGGGTWIGVTRDAVMLRANTVKSLWMMVARTAFAQLGYSYGLLAVCTLVMLVVFAVPLGGLVAGGSGARGWSAGAVLLMALGYMPTVRFYGQRSWVAFTLPIIGLAFLAMTYTSALWYARGVRTQWKGRAYARRNV